MNSRRRLLIVGASAYQHYIYAVARDLGLEIYSVDGDPNAPMFARSDKYAPIDFADTKAVARFAKENSIQAVATINIDQGMNSVCAIQAAVGQRHLESEAVLSATRKDLMRKVWAQAGVTQPNFWVFSVETRADIHDLLADYDGDLIIKPVDNSAKRGISVLTGDRESVDEAVDQAFSASKEGLVIVEELIDGDLVFAATYVRGDEPYVRLMKQSFNSNLVQVRFDAPFTKGESTDALAVEVAVKSATVFGEGPFHTEMIISRSGVPYLVETSPRVSYATIALSRLVDGFDPVTQILSEAFEEEFSFDACQGGASASLVHLEPRPGTAIQPLSQDWVRGLDGIYEVVPVAPAGHVVGPFRTNVDRVMYFVAYGTTASDVEQTSSRVSGQLLDRCFV